MPLPLLLLLLLCSDFRYRAKPMALAGDIDGGDLRHLFPEPSAGIVTLAGVSVGLMRLSRTVLAAHAASTALTPHCCTPATMPHSHCAHSKKSGIEAAVFATTV